MTTMGDMLQELAKIIENAVDGVNYLNVCNSPVDGDNPGEKVFWVQYPFKPTGKVSDLGKQYRITIREDEL